jgi:uncharacterized protein (UPF0261 family)/ABC-type branched-subunit amino acid transport system ATPase component
MIRKFKNSILVPDMNDRVQNRRPAPAALQVKDLHVYYGQSHALQGVNLTLDHGVLAVVGRNGMGKTTLCNTIMGLVRARRGSIKMHGDEITGKPPHKIAAMGIGYTPQGRRLWPSLSVDEHMKLSERGGAWTIERIYDTFPRLYERRANGAGQLSGGEQQMLAISRALLHDPQLLVLDEPTEGLAPVIVDQLEKLLADLAADSDVSILLIEQNISVATSISEHVAIMTNGRISKVMPSLRLAADRTLQERLLGVGRHSHEDLSHEDLALEDLTHEKLEPEIEKLPARSGESSTRPVGFSDPEPAIEADVTKPKSTDYRPPTRWSNVSWQEIAKPERTQTTGVRSFEDLPSPLVAEPLAPLGSLVGNDIYVVGTFDTKRVELTYIREQIAKHDLTVRTVDLSTSGKPSSADIPPHMIAAYHPGGANVVFTDDRGTSVRAMGEAFENWIQRQRGIGGIISAGGSGATALATPAMRKLPIGVPKVMISTVASGEVGQYVGPSDIAMIYSVTDVQGLNKISRRILANGANALVGMVKGIQKSTATRQTSTDRPGLGLTMFGVTTQAVQQLTAALDEHYECLVFHATGTGGQSMEKLVDSGMLEAAIDLTTTEICDMMMGGVFAATQDRFGAFIRTSIPWVGSVGALDMVNFGARNTVPERYQNRTFVEHNPQVTLMRTTAEENTRMGEWIGDRINQMKGPVRFLIPEGGVSALDIVGQPFFDPQADKALFDAITSRVKETATCRIIRTEHNINDPAFTKVAVDALEDIDPKQRSKRNVAY